MSQTYTVSRVEKNPKNPDKSLFFERGKLWLNEKGNLTGNVMIEGVLMFLVIQKDRARFEDNPVQRMPLEHLNEKPLDPPF
tara:strand:+ start:2295 stop:2537 length:243 start_codon:yes stop_codon:yes gene_type:complete